KLTGWQVEQTALEVDFRDGLAGGGLVVHVSRDRFETVLRNAVIALEEVQAGGAGAGRGAEARAETAQAAKAIAGIAKALAHVRRSEDGTHTLERIHACLTRGRDRDAVVDDGFPGPIRTRDGALKTGDQIVGCHIRVGCA